MCEPRAVAQVKEDFMKITIGLALASGLFLMVGGCTTATKGGATAGAGGATVASAGEIRNFNLEVKCPGVHYFKTHGYSDQQIAEKLMVTEDQIASCEAWVAAQPKGYVPPPPPGYVPPAKQTAPPTK
jgi:hypothetical protein